MTEPALSDDAARSAIRTRTDATLFVDAGAGSGKTSALIGRIVQLVLMDRVPIGHIAAVTFTERAAAELRERTRTALENERSTATGAEIDVIDEALDGLDLATIGTLHAFAQQLLTQHPIEAGIPPLIEVLDAVGSSVAFEARWAQVKARLLEDPAMADALAVVFGAGIKLDQLRPMITVLNNDWDMVQEHVLATSPPSITIPDLTGHISSARRLASEADTCADSQDKFVPSLRGLRVWAESASAADRLVACMQALRAAGDLKFSYGKAANWDDLKGLKEDCKDCVDDITATRQQMVDAALRTLVHWCGRDVLAAARTGKRRDG